MIQRTPAASAFNDMAGNNSDFNQQNSSPLGSFSYEEANYCHKDSQSIVRQ